MINNNVPETKPNDWFVVNILNPTSSFEDLHQMAIMPSNTALQDKAFYREDPTIKKLFSENPQNSFDQMAFNLYYDNLVQKYNAFEKEKYSMQDLTKNLYYSEYNYVAPVNAKREKNAVQISKIFNPDSQKIGAIQPELWASSEFSIREIAQTQEVKNQNNVGLGFTPNDDSKSGLLDFWFDKFFVTKDALALAQWTEDGTHTDPVSGDILNHKKGEYKFNELGKYYYETLEGKTPLNRTLLSPWDTITDDGSWQNKFDFMDSDDKKKSVGATILKSVATITPYFIPGVGQYYALFTAAQAQQEFLPQVATMAGRFVSGAEFDQSDLYKRLNSIQAFGTTMTMSSVSDNSMEKIWTWENLFTLVPEIFVQLKQQNALAKIPKWIKATNADAKQMNVLSKTVDQEKLKEARKLWKQALNTKDPSQAAVLKKIALLHADDKNLVELYDKWVSLENTIAKGLALGYMTAASAGEIDSVIEKFGIQGRDAAWMKLGVLQAFWLSMSTWSLGDWQVDYAVSLKDASKELNKLLKTKGLSIQKDLDTAGAKLTLKEVNENVAEGVVSSTWNKLRGASGQEVFKKGLAFGKDLISRIDGNTIAKSIVKESIEEMSEETFTDGAKVVYNVFSDLNLTETKDKKINWDDDDVLSRYAMAGIGGALGGFLFHANESFLRPIKNQQFDRQLEDISIDLIRNNRVHELYEAIENIRVSDKGFASKNLSFSIYNKLTNIDGKTINFEPASKDKLSQNDVIANVLKSQLQFLEKQIFNAHVPSTQQIQDVFAERTGSLLSINMHTAIEDDIKRASSQFVELYSKLEELNSKEKLDDSEEKRKAALFLELQTKQKEIEEITSEESIGKYYGEAMFNLDKHLNSTYTETIDEEDISQSLYKKGYNELNEIEKENVSKALTIENSREQLRIKKRLFDLQAKIFNTSIFTVSEQLQLRKDILPALNSIQFDYEKSKDEFDTEIAPHIPQYAKNYISDFLKGTSFTIDQINNNDASVQNFEKFFSQTQALVEKQQIDPKTLTNEEFLFLKYLKQALKASPSKLEKIINPNIVDFFKDNYFNPNDVPESYTFDSFYRGLSNELESKSIYNIWEEFQNNDEIKSDNFIYDFFEELTEISQGQGNAKLALEFLKSTNDPRLSFIEKQLQLYTSLEKLEVLKQDPLFSQLDILLSKFDVQYKSNTKNILDLIQQERERLLEKPLEDYINTSEITELEIKRQLEQLARLKVIIYAYTNFSLDPKTAIGYFPALNQYNQNNGLTEVYSQIPSDLSLFLLNHISEVEDKLNYLKKLSEQNQNSKIPNKEKAEAVINVLQTRQLLKILNNIVVPDEEKQLKDALAGIGDLNLFFTQSEEKELDKNLESLRNSDLQKILETSWKIEITIQKYFNGLDLNKKKLFLNDLFTEFLNSQEKINQLRKEIMFNNFTEYKKQTRSISKTDTLIHILSTLFSDTELFVKDFNELLTTTPIKFALFGDQQNAFKLAHNIVQNQFSEALNIKRDLTFKEALKLFEERATKEIESYHNDPEQTKPKTFGKIVMDGNKMNYIDEHSLKFNYQNIFAIYGVQGTGKTEAILNFLSIILDKKGLNSIGLAHEENISEKLLNHLVQNKITNVKSQDLKSIFKLIFGAENYEELLVELKKSNKETEIFTVSNVQFTENDVVSFIELNKNHPLIVKIRQNLQEVQKQDFRLGKDIISVLLIDEQTQTNKFIFELLNEYVDLYNAKTSPNKLTVLVTGDWRQQGQTISYLDGSKVVLAPNVISEDLSLKSMDLNSSLRVGNNIKTFNAEELSNFTEKTHTNQPSNKKIRLKHSTNGGLFGDFAQDFNNPTSSPESIIKKLKELGISVKDIVLIQEKDNSNFQALAQQYGIDLIYTEQMNGVQYDYAIIDVNALGMNNISINAKLLNTFLTRSKKASFFNVNFLEESGIELEQINEKVVFDNSLKPEKIEQYKEKRIRMINAIANSLFGAEIVTKIPIYTEPSTKSSDNSSIKFSAGQFVSETEISGKDLQKAFLEWNEANTNESEQKEKIPSLLSKKNMFGLIQMNHKFGKETDIADPEEVGKPIRRFYNPGNRQREIDIITSIAKSIFIKNLYGSGNPDETLYPILLKEVKKTIARDIKDLDLVFYNRKFDPNFDKRVDDSIQTRITVLSLKLTLNDGEIYYIPLGGQSQNIEEILLENYPNELEEGTDIILDRKYLVRFLSPNLSLNIISESVKIDDLKNDGFIVSPIYVLANSQFKEAKGNFVRNGREFVLVSKDRRLSPELLFNTFKYELNAMINNKLKKGKLSKEYIDEQMLDAYALSDSSVKLVYLDRIGLPFYSETEKDWLTAISEGRSEKDFLTVRSFADAYVASQMLSVLTKKYIQLNMNSLDPKTRERNTDLLEQAELEFLTFYEELIKVITVLAQYGENSTVLTKQLAGNSKDIIPILEKIDQTILSVKDKKMIDPMFTTDHKFVYLLKASIDGGSYKVGERMISVKQIFDNDAKKRIKNFISETLSESKVFSGGIHYTAQIGKGTKDDDFQYIQDKNTDVNMFNVNRVIRNNLYLPLSLIVTESKPEPEEETTPVQENALKKVLENHATQLSVAMHSMNNISEEIKTKIMNLFKETIDSNINDISLSEKDILDLFIDNANLQNYITIDKSPIVFRLTEDKIEIVTSQKQMEKDQITLAKEELKQFLEQTALTLNPEVIEQLLNAFQQIEFVTILLEQNLPQDQFQDIINKVEELRTECQPDTTIDSDPFA